MYIMILGLFVAIFIVFVVFHVSAFEKQNYLLEKIYRELQNQKK